MLGQLERPAGDPRQRVCIDLIGRGDADLLADDRTHPHVDVGVLDVLVDVVIGEACERGGVREDLDLGLIRPRGIEDRVDDAVDFTFTKHSCLLWAPELYQRIVIPSAARNLLTIACICTMRQRECAHDRAATRAPLRCRRRVITRFLALPGMTGCAVRRRYRSERGRSRACRSMPLGHYARTNVSALTDEAPASSSARAHAPSVAPVVMTSSMRRTRRPSMRDASARNA